VFLLDDLKTLRWHSYQRVPNILIDNAWRNWVLDRGSLTQRLIIHSANNFSVRLLRELIDTPLNSERRALGLGIRRACLVREVALLCHHLPVVYARSIIPLATLRGKERQLANLGEKPLGAFLFQHRKMTRGPLELAPFHGIFSADNRMGWGRRSVFYLNKRPLLVSEFFLPDLLNKHQPAANQLRRSY
jgi:chorismate lyase